MADYRLFNPATQTFSTYTLSNIAAGRTQGVEINVTQAGWLTQVHFWKPTSTVVVNRYLVYEIGNTTPLVNQTVASSVGGWNTFTLPTALALDPTKKYRVAVHISGGNGIAPGTSNYWLTGTGTGGPGITSGILKAPGSSTASTAGSGTGGAQGPYQDGAFAYPNTTNTSKANYGVDVTVTDVNPTLKPKLSTLSTDFSSMPAFFTLNYGTPSVVGGEGRAPTTNSYSGFETAKSYSFDGDSVHVQVVQSAGTQLSWQTSFMVKANGTNNSAEIIHEAGNLLGRVNRNGTWQDVTLAAPYSASTHRWWRIRESGGTVFFDTSIDGVTWTQRGSQVHLLDFTTASVALGSGHYNAADTGAPDAVFDNFNLEGVAFTTDLGDVTSWTDGEGTGTGTHTSSGVTESTSTGSAVNSISTGSSGAADSASSGSAVSFPGYFGQGATDSSTDGTATAVRTGVGLGSSESQSDGLATGSGVHGSLGSVDSYTDGSGLGKLAQVGELNVYSDGSGTHTAGHTASGDVPAYSDGIGQPSGQHVSPGDPITSSSSTDAKHSGNHTSFGTPVTVTSTTDGTGESKQLSSAGITRPIVGMTVRLIDQDNQPADFLPDWTSLSFTEQLNAAGTIAIEYATNGVNAAKLRTDRVEGAIFDGEYEMQGTRFMVTQSSTDAVMEDASGAVMVLNCPQYVPARLAEATIYPPSWPPMPGVGLKAAAQELYNHILLNGAYFEDFSFYGNSTNMRAYNDQLVDLFSRESGADEDNAWADVVKVKDFLLKIVNGENSDANSLAIKTQFPAQTPGQIIGTLMARARTRGAIPEIVQNFSATHDSGGAAWANVVSMEVEPGGTVLSVLEKLTEMGVCDWACNGREIQIFNPNLQPDYTVTQTPVVLQAGKDILDAPEKRDTQRVMNTCLVVGKDGVTVEVKDQAEITRRGKRIEGFVSVSGVSDEGTLTVIGNKSLEKAKLSTESLTHGLSLFDPSSPQPWVDYKIGSWVFRDMGDGTGPQRYRVAQLSCTYENSGAITGAITLGARFQSTAQKLQAQIDALTNGSEAISAPANNPAEDSVAPQTPAGLLVTSYAYESENGWGTKVAAVQAGWNSVEYNEDGSVVKDLDRYEVRWRGVDDVNWMIAGSPRDPSVSWSPVAPNYAIRVQVRAVDRNGNASAWSAEYPHITAGDDEPPPVPTAPKIEAYLGQLRISWDGFGT